MAFDDLISTLDSALAAPPGQAPSTAPENQGLSYPPVEWQMKEPPPSSEPDRGAQLSSVLDAALKPPPSEDFGPPMSAAPKHEVNPVASMGQGMIDTLAGGAQGIAPYAGEGAKLAPPEEQAFFSEVGQPRDQQKFVAARDPRTGQYAVFHRTPEMEESRLATMGRLLPWATSEARSAGMGAAKQLSGGQQLLQDYQQLGMTPNTATVGQGGIPGAVTKALSFLPWSAERLRGGLGEASGAAASKTEELAGAYGTATNPEQGGRALQSGIQQFGRGEAPAGMTAAEIISSPVRYSGFGAKSSALYDRLYGLLPQGAQYSVDNTISALRGLADRFPTNPEFGTWLGSGKNFGEGAKILEPHTTEIPAVYSSIVDQYGQPILRQMAQKVQSGGSLTFDEIKNARSLIGEKLGDFQFMSDIPRSEWKRLYGGLSDDLRTAAAATSPEALSAFEQANRFYQAGMKRVDQLMPILGKAENPKLEDMFHKVNAAAQAGRSANAGLLRSIQRSMPEDQWQNVGSTVIERMGQPATGENAFSPLNWANNWNKLSDAAKDTLFGADVAGSNRSNLEALSRIMQANKNLGKLSHPVMEAGAGAIGLWEAAKYGAENFHEILSNPTAHLAIAAGAVAAPRIAASLLMSPNVTNWLYHVGPTILGAPSTQVGVQRALAGADFATRGSPYLQQAIAPLKEVLSYAGQAALQSETQSGQEPALAH